jgi:hypothetical protein
MTGGLLPVSVGAEPLETHGHSYNCCWPSPVHSCSDPSPMGLTTIFYCLRFETSLFVASYDSQGYIGGTRPCLHTGIKSQLQYIFQVKVKSSHIVTDCQSVSQSVWGSGPDIYYCLTVTVLSLWGTLSDERAGLSYVRVIVCTNKSLVIM